MTRHLLGSRWVPLAVLAMIAIELWPAVAEAGIIAFRNDTDNPVLVQGISVINRVVRRGKLHLLRPGEVGRELILVPGTQIIIVDAKQPTRILCQEAIPLPATELFFAIQSEVPDKPKEKNDSSKAKDRKVVTPKVKLVPSKPTPPSTPPPPMPHR